MGLQNAAVGCEVIGLLAHGYITYHIGYRRMMLLSLVWMCFGVFPAFFANNIVVLIVSQAICGIPPFLRYSFTYFVFQVFPRQN